MGQAALSTAVEAVRNSLQRLSGTAQDYDRLVELVGDARCVLLGEASHGTYEFYHERAEITKRLIQEKGIQAVAVEADWPDAYRVNHYVRGTAILRGEAGIGKKRKDVSFDDVAEAFLKWVKDNKRPNTYKDYALCIGQLKRSFSGKRLSQISPITVERHKQMRKEQGAKVRANRELAVLKNLFNRARRELKLYEGTNPVEHVKMLHEDQRRLRFLEPDEEERLLAQAAEPLRSMILLGIHTGLRARAEMLTLRWDNVDLKRRVLTIIGAYAKNKESRQVNLNSKVVDALTRLKDHAASEYVFAKPDGMPYDSIRNAFASACQRAGLEDVTPHTLRHSFASRLVMAGVDLRTIQELGGWKQLRMIDRYGHVNDRHKAEAVEKLVGFHNAIHNTRHAEIAVIA